MKVTLIHCGPPANESELKAFAHIKDRLISIPGQDEWIILTNLAFSVTNQLQSDEIDIIAISPSGVRVVEVKHWTSSWVKNNPQIVQHEADKLSNKARKIGTTLRREVPDLDYVGGVFLLTQDSSKVQDIDGHMVRGIRFNTLSSWQDALQVGSPRILSPTQIQRLAQRLDPKIPAAINGDIRRLAGYINLELQSPQEDRFHREYRGTHSSRKDRVILHLYDLTANAANNAESVARREFSALRHLQIFPWAPRILDSFQRVPGFDGEMFFCTLVDPAAPNLLERAHDTTWDTAGRIAFAQCAVRALSEFHGVAHEEGALVHRNLNPKTILVRHDNSVFITGFRRTKIPLSMTVVSDNSSLESDEFHALIPPEVHRQSWSAADQRSDIFSLAASLKLLFHGREDPNSVTAVQILDQATAEDPRNRSTLESLDERLSHLLGEPEVLPAPPPVRFWTEDQRVQFNGRTYQIVSKLGSGGVGATFKVVDIDPSSNESTGTYVAKVVFAPTVGKRVLHSHRLIRSHLGSDPGLATVFEVSNEWQENQFVALMKWVDGPPLADFTGVFPLLAEDQQEDTSESLAIRWLLLICDALDILHRNGLVHGDISPRNMIVSGSRLVLTDYDFVTKQGHSVDGPGTVLYCPPDYALGSLASPANDLYSLAASFFHVVFEKEPFHYGGLLAKERGVNWDTIDRNEVPILSRFIDRATHPDPAKRFQSVQEAIALLALPQIEKSPDTPTLIPQSVSPSEYEVPTQPKEQRIEWLYSLLQSYPGSLLGNADTRGLDSSFAEQTYVETRLEASLLDDIRSRSTRLVILCGNAGDGKTALLQHLAGRLGFGMHKSAERVIQKSLPDGLNIRMNLA